MAYDDIDWYSDYHSELFSHAENADYDVQFEYDMNWAWDRFWETCSLGQWAWPIKIYS